ncbi:MAG TPA: DNA ligase D [Polyangia bacterium]|jgi:bifunctional non-homologous end joining protein LigD|nr:DNA ligase D [Polyangia bacterium]
MQPMLATLADAPLRDPRLVYEPKYDGIRAIVTVSPDATPVVAIASRLGNDKTGQFPEIVRALERWARGRHGPVILDGEIVALDRAGEPLSFGHLQPRIHLQGDKDVERLARSQPAALYVFDLLRDGDEDLCRRPLLERRERLVKALGFGEDERGPLRLSRQVVGDGEALQAEAEAAGWEGLIVKEARSPYRPGRRSSEWRKIKLFKRQEFVVGGWTEPRGSRARFGALLLGLPAAGGRLRYVGHVGGGFSDDSLRRIGARLAPLEQKDTPFEGEPPTNDRPHWTRPALVVEVRFGDWTQDGHLRHPVFLGVRDDVVPSAVTREEPSVIAKKPPRMADRPAPAQKRTPRRVESEVAPPTASLVDALSALEERGSGRLTLPTGESLELGNLKKVLWPELGITKGELLRYYATIAPQLLPVVRDRPLVMRRFPDGISGPAFYQHRAPDDVPPGVRSEAVPGDTDVPSRLIGGSLTTLLYMAQLAVLSQDPYFSRVQSIGVMDFAAIDLDPMGGASFATVLDVARWVRDELVDMGVTAFPKTSGASGLHVYVPLPPGTPYKAGMLFCQIVGEIVAKKHPRQATVERMVNRRDDEHVYVDCLQNIEGKTLACAYSARASAFGGASTPLTWDEVDAGVDPADFTIRTLPARVREAGDLWEELRTSPGIDLHAALERVHARHGR